METQLNRLIIFSILTMTFLFTGCMRQYPQGSGGSGQGLGSVLNSVGGKTSIGGSASDGSLSNADKSSLQTVVKAADAVSADKDANAKAQGIDAAISKALLDDINKTLADERDGVNVVEKKWQLVGQILVECQQKAKPLVPIQGQPLIGDWTGSGACGLNTFSINGPGKDYYYPGQITGAQNVKVAAYNDGRFALSSDKWNGTGTDTGFEGKNLSGVGTLNTQIPSTTKYGTTYSPCAAKVKLVTSRNPIPANYQSAVKIMGSCYRNATALLGMDAIFKNMDPALSQTLIQQMLK